MISQNNIRDNFTNLNTALKSLFKHIFDLSYHSPTIQQEWEGQNLEQMTLSHSQTPSEPVCHPKFEQTQFSPLPIAQPYESPATR